jgi:hypothetical protein
VAVKSPHCCARAFVASMKAIARQQAYFNMVGFLRSNNQLTIN